MTFEQLDRNFTFFPDPAEQQSIADAKEEDLAAFLMLQPDMSGRYVHELWRSGRVSEITELVEKYRAITPLTYYDLARSVALMHCLHRQPLGGGRAFLSDVTEAIVSGPNSTPYLEGKTPRQIGDDSAQSIIVSVQRMILTYQANTQNPQTN